MEDQTNKLINDYLRIIVLLGSLIHGLALANPNMVIESLKKARSCTVSTFSKGNQVDCSYKLDQFHLSIAGVGQKTATIAFMNSNFDGMFWGSVSKLHGCAIVKNGANYAHSRSYEYVKPAFISPVNGVVYDNWQDCAKALRK